MTDMMQLNLEDQIYAKRREVRYDMRDLTVEYIADKYEDGIDYSNTDEEERKDKKIKRNILFIPEYQREFTWDEKRQSKLIESILLGLPIPFIFVAENTDGAWEIVDGSQRIRTIHAFVKNELKLTGLESLHLANGLNFSEIESTRAGKFLDTALRIIILSEETTEEVKKDMFERINRGSDLLKAMEKRKGIYPGPFTSFIYDFVEKSEEFRRLLLVDKWLENRQERSELLLRFFALSENENYRKSISGSISDFLDKYLENKNKELREMSESSRKSQINKYEKKINDVITIVKNRFPYGFRHTSNPQTKRAVFEAISVGVWVALSQNKISEKYNKDEIKKMINSEEFKQYTHITNQLHKSMRMQGRVNFIISIMSGEEL
ncbi:DUF262 domain-containing protein [Pantoea sp. X85]|uniref:DUF262 domain-containing protein n=1 Tax=Pantoea sp. X85 TaxID=3037258 RepID=UPI00241367F2|nr:DUF262 domain-containing protein [Pantoea sp. X85]WFL68036.1 DUF262 domain-containing protein [Pantoea sp. X85]